MLESVILRCRPGAQFHFGRIALDVDTSLHDTSPIMRSDTFASALTETASRVFSGDTFEKTLEDFKSGRVRFSSLFFCLEKNDGGIVYFLPKPASLDTHLPGKDKITGEDKERKTIYRVKFISKGVWEQGILPEEWDEKCVTLRGGFLATKEELSNILDKELLDKIRKTERENAEEKIRIAEKETREKISLFDTVSLPKVAVHKMTRENSLYFQTNIQLPDLQKIEGLTNTKVHFYFLLESEDGDARNRAHTLAQIMADEGIGGERTTGCGELEGCDEPQPFDLKPSETKSALLASASLLSPASDAELAACLAYKVETRAGRRIPRSKEEAEKGMVPFLKRLKMIGEGALLAKKVQGKWHDIAPPNCQDPFLRFGLPICLPLHDKFDLNLKPDAS